MSTADTLEALRTAALRQPGAVERTGIIKFQCPACAAEGHDTHQDNAVLFLDDGKWGCAVASIATTHGRAHWEAIGQALGALTHRSASNPEAPWPAPEPLPETQPAVPPFDVDALLPAPLAAWVRDIAHRMQCPVEFVAVPAVVSAAGVLGRRLAIRPKRLDDWTVVPNLWGVMIGPPGVMKSPAAEEALKPVRRLVTAATTAHAEAMRTHAFREAEAKARRELLQKELKETLKNGGATDAIRAQFDMLECPPPVARRYLVNDATVEKLGELLRENPNGLLLYRDELVGWLRMMDREGHENDRAFFCEAWNGSGPYIYDRIGRGTLEIPAACVSVLGGMQPGPLASYLREIFSHGSQDDGLIQRFQLLVWPDVARDWINVDARPDTEAEAAAAGAIAALDTLDPTALGAHAMTDGNLPILHFAPEAQAGFDAWRTDWESRIRAGREPDVLVVHWAKYRSLVPSLAQIFHAIACAPSGTGGPVSAEALTRALAWVPYLEAHARRCYHVVTHSTAAALSALAAKLTAREVPNPFRARDVARCGWTALPDAEAVTEAAGRLEQLGWLRAEPVPASDTGGRPTVQYHVNPAIAGHGPHD